MESEAMASLDFEAPDSYEGMPRQSLNVKPLHLHDANDSIWIGTISYGWNAPETTSTSIFQFDTGGGSQHITQSKANIANYPEGAPDHKGAIGVTGTGVEGVDIGLPVYNFTEIRFYEPAAINAAFKANLFNLSWKVNNASCLGYAAGELLFMGASGSGRGREKVEIAYKFSASPNKTDLQVGDITGIAKKGWEYLWVEYEDAEDETAHKIVKKPIAVHIEQTYDYADLNGLPI